MKKIVLIVLNGLLFFPSLLECMQANAITVGAFAYAERNTKEGACYDIKSVNNNVGVGLFDGRCGKKVAKLLKKKYFDMTFFKGGVYHVTILYDDHGKFYF